MYRDRDCRVIASSGVVAAYSINALSASSKPLTASCSSAGSSSVTDSFTTKCLPVLWFSIQISSAAKYASSCSIRTPLGSFKSRRAVPSSTFSHTRYVPRYSPLIQRSTYAQSGAYVIPSWSARLKESLFRIMLSSDALASSTHFLAFAMPRTLVFLSNLIW